MIIRNVGEFVAGKSLFSARETVTIAEACVVLRERNIGALAVLRDGDLVGILSERDVITRVVARGRDPKATTVGDVMTPDPQTVDVSGGLTDALDKMMHGRFRHLPVVEDGVAVGMVSMRDIPTEYRFMYQRYREAIGEPALSRAHSMASDARPEVVAETHRVPELA